MPRLFVGVRKRDLVLRFDAAKTLLEEAVESKENILEYAHSIVYIIGGLLLVLGSVFFLPDLYEPYPLAGTYCFIIASVFYFYVSASDVLEVLRAHQDDKVLEHKTSASSDFKDRNLMQRALHAQQKTHMQEFFASTSYAIGAALFILGCIFFLPNVGQALAAGWCFVIGSALFLVGAIYNVLLIWESPDRKSTHLANLIANTYVIGSSFYLCASLPYLDTNFNDADDEWVVFTGSASLYVAGSILFTLGGALDLYRAQYIRNYVPQSNGSNTETLEALQAEEPTLAYTQMPEDSSTR